ncbi:hypothetical protein DPMN_156151 [Dreissena polymorpha]|uniref:Uncharacterized protein n=1 Tax=Dreissena polymorpha TaxID=45954 RepID=A0A9D4JBK4_DREPO|nr:hypothetical protein DPMN_156151 [Dreissena polymorpha]
MADLLHVSDSSVKRRLRSFGLKLRQTYSVLSNNALDDLVREVTQGNPSLGQRMVQGLLQSRGHRAGFFRPMPRVRNSAPFPMQIWLFFPN